ncbi:hypothetical protein [Pseudolysinimonas sp.]|uniref:hypothetical protein n=1 Tax=Pseudolysinimonas sp. TaxID=2680009 RepID=UPI0037851187
MTSPAPRTEARSPRPLGWWLAPLGVFAVVAIGTLWAIPRPAEACIMIYPAPPECATGGAPTALIPFLVLIVGLYAAIVTCALLIPARLRPLVLGVLAGAMALVFLIGLASALAAAQQPQIFS